MTLIELFVVILVVGILFVLVMPVLMEPCGKKRSAKIGCVNNLKQTALALKIWAGDNSDKYPWEVAVTNGGALDWTLTTNAWKAFEVMSNELFTPKILFCPSDSARDYATNWDGTLAKKISYFIGLDAKGGDGHNAAQLLSGDDNFETNGIAVKFGLLALGTNTPPSWTKARHNRAGNIGLNDGSVQPTTTSSLRTYWQQTGVATNRIFIP